MTRASIVGLWGPALSRTLPPDLLQRYLAAIRFTRLGKAVDHWKPPVAGMVLVDHGRRNLGLTTMEPAATVRGMARRERVRSVVVSPHAYLPTLDDFPRLTTADQDRCLSEQLDNLDREKESAATIARAWAAGDLRTLRETYRPPSACEDMMAPDRAGREAVVRSTLAAISDGLAAGGRTVVLADVSILLNPGFFGGLEARGAVVRAPKE